LEGTGANSLCWSASAGRVPSAWKGREGPRSDYPHPAPKTAKRVARSEAVTKESVTNLPARRVGAWIKLRKVLSMEHVTPTVGLMTLAGCLTFLIAPNDDPGADARMAAALNPGLPMVVLDPGHGGRTRELLQMIWSKRISRWTWRSVPSAFCRPTASRPDDPKGRHFCLSDGSRGNGEQVRALTVCEPPLQ
jgi:hypothetical protein